MAGANYLAVNDEEREQFRVRDSRRTGAELFLLFGGALVFVGVVNLGFVWLPTNLASNAWKFGLLGQTLEHLPVVVFGFGLLAYGAVRHRDLGTIWVRTISLVLAVMATAVLGVGVLHALAAPAVLQGGTAATGGSGGNQMV